MIIKVKIDFPLEKNSTLIEYLKEGETCPFCQFSQLKKEGNEVFCHLCGYGYKGCT